MIIGNGIEKTAPTNDGINLEGNIHDLQLKDNTIANNGRYSINIKTHKGYTDCYNLAIEDNTLNSNGINTINIEGTKEKRIFGENILNGKRAKIGR